MSQNSLDAIESALKHLKDIVAKNHSADASDQVNQMEKLVEELKTKAFLDYSPKHAEDSVIVAVNTTSVTV